MFDPPISNIALGVAFPIATGPAKFGLPSTQLKFAITCIASAVDPSARGEG